MLKGYEARKYHSWVGIQYHIATLENCFAVSCKVKYTLIWSSSLVPRYLLKRTENLFTLISHKKLKTYLTQNPIYERLWQHWASLVTQMIKNLPAMLEAWVWSLGWKDPLEEVMAIHSSTLAWRVPLTEVPGGLQSMGSQRVGHDWVTKQST